MNESNRLGSRFYVNKTSQTSGRYSAQMQTAMKQKGKLMLGHMHLSMIELLAWSIWPQNAVLRACYSRNFYLEATIPTIFGITSYGLIFESAIR